LWPATPKVTIFGAYCPIGHCCLVLLISRLSFWKVWRWTRCKMEGLHPLDGV
jgi:hypothetical protein